MDLFTPVPVRRRLDALVGVRGALHARRHDLKRRLDELSADLDLAGPVELALQHLSDRLFGDLVTGIEKHLTQALQEVLGQAITLKVHKDFQRKATTMDFYIDRDGQAEDILRGQGGSVANVLSVGLRMLALTTLDTTRHRRFLILDEQDCWLRPDLVPRLIRLIHQGAKSLGFQVLLISHHDSAAFEPYADCVYRLAPSADGVTLSRAHPDPRDAGN
jgi:hypothetical protein